MDPWTRPVLAEVRHNWWSQGFEKGQKAVGWLESAQDGFGWRSPVQGPLLDGHVCVKVSAGRRRGLVAEPECDGCHGVAALAGIGFTVSLLIGDLAYGPDSARGEHVKVGVLVGSLTAAVIAAVILRLRNRTYRRLCEVEELDTDQDGTPDVYEVDSSRPVAP